MSSIVSVSGRPGTGKTTRSRALARSGPEALQAHAVGTTGRTGKAALSLVQRGLGEGPFRPGW